MPWKVCSPIDERLRFVAHLLDREAMTDVCREFGISRKTGYKILARYKDESSAALSDRSRRPVRYANQLPPQIEGPIVSLKRGKPHWGARKIRELLVRRLPGDLRVPAQSTIHAVLDRHGLVSRMGRPRRRAQGAPLSTGRIPTISGVLISRGVQARQQPLLLPAHRHRSRLALPAALRGARFGARGTRHRRLRPPVRRARPAKRNPLRERRALRPFASPNALFNLSKLSVWWLRLGIAIERIKPGNPQQNGRHERMHLTLKHETTRPPGMNSLQQQARFDEFVEEFNTERPHEALEMRRPADIYTFSSKPYLGLPDLEYPLHNREYTVIACGRICMHRKKINVSTVLAGQKLGLKEVDDGIWGSRHRTGRIARLAARTGTIDRIRCRLR